MEQWAALVNDNMNSILLAFVFAKVTYAEQFHPHRLYFIIENISIVFILRDLSISKDNSPFKWPYIVKSSRGGLIEVK